MAATTISIPEQVTMGAMGRSQKNVLVKVTVPGRATPQEYALGPDVSARDLFMMLQDDFGATPKNQRLFLKGKRLEDDVVLGKLSDGSDALELTLMFAHLNGGGDDGCQCCGLHCMAYPECKMRVCCFFSGCDLLFNKLQILCCTWQYMPCEWPEAMCQCVFRICCCVNGCDTKCCQCQFYFCKCACCTDIEMD